MGLFALILALAAEQLRPLPRNNPVHRLAVRVAQGIAARTDAGLARHGLLAWSLAVGVAMLAVVLAQALLETLGVLPVLILHVFVLYHTIGFRQFSHAFTEIQIALAANDVEGARQVLQDWIRQRDPDFTITELPVDELCRMAIAHALIAAHRHVFGPLFWYLILPGAIGPVLYRCAQFLAGQWAHGGHPEEVQTLPGLGATGASRSGPASTSTLLATEPFGEFPVLAYRLLDWIPVRLSAAGFAVVGNFEDAVYCWRAAASVQGGDTQRRVLLLTGSGALGLRLMDVGIEAELSGAGADPEASAGGLSNGFEWQGAAPDAAGLRSAVGLVWRAVVLWVGLFAMLTLASWTGG